MHLRTLGLLLAAAVPSFTALAAVTAPPEVEQPGTQPGEVGALEGVAKCDNCHGGYNAAVEPSHNWRGSMMSQAGRDPLFWATLAVAEQDFDGSGDICLRCHAPAGWLAGRSTPTDGSGLLDGADTDGVECDVCHKLVNPDNSEHVGVQTAPYLAHDEASPATAYYGSGQYVYWNGADKLGPYSNADARHQFKQSRFHRSADLCATCHDVSNAVTGDLSPWNGAQVPLAAGTYSGVVGSPVASKAAFNDFPYAYGIVERTSSEHAASGLAALPVSSYATLPSELQAGAIAYARNAALVAGKGGNYEDGTTRTFTCQTCHVPATTGQGCNKRGVLTRKDLPWHDMTGGNTWVPDAILYLDSLGLLTFGGGLTSAQTTALLEGQARALSMLSLAASLQVSGNTARVVNLTGHKLISGYPEGRRMWLNVRWYDATDTLLREDGAWGPLDVVVDGVHEVVNTILDLEDPYLRIWEAHFGMSQEWAIALVDMGYDPTLPLTFDRVTGAATLSLGDLADGIAGDHAETFHFVLNDLVVADNRIPPYGFSYDEALERNALPVPEEQYGAPTSGGTYLHYDDVALTPPTGATWAEVDLLYQPTSWEYIQFLYLANEGLTTLLLDEGLNLLEAWLNTGMAEPTVMASTTWGTPPVSCPATVETSCSDGLDDDCDKLVDCLDPDCAAASACICDKDKVCETGEDCTNCPTDCSSVTGGKPASRYCCGNGIAETAEKTGTICNGNF